MEDYKFIEIDYENWDRKEIYEAYKDMSYFVTIDVDVTHYFDLYRSKIKFYPFMSYVASRVANENKIYRMAVVDGKVGYFDRVDPLYTLLRSNKLFTHKVTTYSPDFIDFYKRFLEDKKVGEASNKLYADGFRPKNSLAISTMPNMSFSHMSFMYDIGKVTEYVPFTTFGKYFERNGRWYCPVSTQFYHEVNDGYHAEQFYIAIQKVIDNFAVDTSLL